MSFLILNQIWTNPLLHVPFCCFLTCIQVSHKTGKMGRYSISLRIVHSLLAIWSLVPLPFLNPSWTSGSLWFTYSWNPAWKILSITLLACEMYVKAVCCHPACLTFMQNILCKMPGWIKHQLESRLWGEISITSDMQMTPPLCRKWRGTKEPLYESKKGKWKSWLKTQHSEN